MIRIGLRGINRAYFNTLGRVMVSFALDALIRVDDVDGFSLADSLYRTLRFTGTATDAFIVDFISHPIYLLKSSMGNTNNGWISLPVRLHPADALLPESFGNMLGDKAVDIASQAGYFFH